MMQPTPAPSSRPNSPPQADVSSEHDTDAPNYPPPPENAGSAPFSVLAGLFEKLQNERKIERRRKLIDGWFNHWRTEKGYDLYPVLRLILPQRDKERLVYGLKEKNLAKTYIKLIPLNLKDPDAIRLLNWKKPSEKDKASGDFPSVLYEVVSKRSSVIEGTLTIDELNTVLDELADKMGKQAEQAKIMQRVYNRTTPEEQRWIVRIILKDMIISVKETTVFSVFHPDAQDLYNTCSDLKRVALTLWNPSFRLDPSDKGVQLFHAFAPMLCKRPTRTIEETVKEMQGSEFIIEEKLDGERMQLHKRGNEYFYCSRKGKDYTYLYGKHVGVGSLTPAIDNAFDSRVEEIILDGEMLVWDPVSQRNLPFGTLKTAALDMSKKELSPRPCFKVFDLLYLNGTSLLDKSVKSRKKNMRACLKEIKGRIEFAAEFRGSSGKDIRDKMDEIMESRGEGLVIKHPLAKYVLNGRNADWIKVKPEYMDNMGECVDLLVVAANYGSGSRGGAVSTLICAVMDDRRDYGEFDDHKYSTFVRIGTGFSYADYLVIRSKNWQQWDPKNPPSFLQTAKKTSEDKGDVYLEPEDSFIVKVKAAEIVSSDQYHLGFTMRFPRALSIRDDLTVADCATAKEISDSLKDDRKRKLEVGDNVVLKSKKRKVTKKKAVMIGGYTAPSAKDIVPETNLFRGMKFSVMANPKSRNGEEERSEIITLILKNGGQHLLVPKASEDLYIVYDGSTTPNALRRIIDKDQQDILKPKWIRDSVQNQEHAPFTKHHLFYGTTERREDPGFDDGTEGDESDVQSVKEELEEDTAHGWFSITKESTAPTESTLSDRSETEDDDDSDNADVASGDDGAIEPNDQDWNDVGRSNEAHEEKPIVNDTPGRSNVVDVSMGESADAMAYDPSRIFSHLCFYLDSPINATANGMLVKVKKDEVVESINNAFTNLEAVIKENGGRTVADLDDAKLTHVILDKRDDSRRKLLIKRTSEPKRRHLVISEFIDACLAEETLLDETGDCPCILPIVDLERKSNRLCLANSGLPRQETSDKLPWPEK